MNPTKPRGFQVPESLTVILKELPGQNTEHLHFWKPVKQLFASWNSFNMGVQGTVKRGPGLNTGTQRWKGAPTALGDYISLLKRFFIVSINAGQIPIIKNNWVDIAVSKNG